MVFFLIDDHSFDVDSASEIIMVSSSNIKIKSLGDVALGCFLPKLAFCIFEYIFAYVLKKWKITHLHVAIIFFTLLFRNGIVDDIFSNFDNTIWHLYI